MASTAHEEHGHGHDHGGDHHHHEEHFVSKYIFSQDHKMIGKQFLMTAVFMGVVAMLLSILFRIQLAWPGESSDFLSFFLGFPLYLNTRFTTKYPPTTHTLRTRLRRCWNAWGYRHLPRGSVNSCWGVSAPFKPTFTLTRAVRSKWTFTKLQRGPC